jgi:hypothetical protein
MWGMNALCRANLPGIDVRVNRSVGLANGRIQTPFAITLTNYTSEQRILIECLKIRMGTSQLGTTSRAAVVTDERCVMQQRAIALRTRLL